MVFVGQKSGRSLAGSSASGSLTVSAIKLLLVISSEGLTRGYVSKLTPTDVGRIQFLKGCWTEGVSFLLALVQIPPSVS